MMENLFPGGPSIPFAVNTETLSEISAMMSLASLGLDWIVSDRGRFDQFMRETAELHTPGGGNPDEYLTLKSAKHLAEHADHSARHVAALADRMRALDQEAAEDHAEQASQARPDTDDI